MLRPFVGVIVALLSLTVAIPAQTPPATDIPVVLMTGLGNWHHPVTTIDPEAQKFFDQGLTLVYAFNHDDAIRSFRQALELDANCAMAHWGIAYALGPNINFDIDSAREMQAYDEIQQALKLSSHLTPIEQDYISALAVRYSNRPKPDLKALNIAYRDAMRALMNKYPNDLDAAVLFCESVMDMNPWQLYNRQCRPIKGTDEIVAILESVLKRDTSHPGANHYYIHCVEASRNPDRALPCAGRLAPLCPAAGHLVHMPAHVYMRVGQYKKAAEANYAAMVADSFYIRNNFPGLYVPMYYNHNVHFFAVASSMIGRYDDAIRAANELLGNIMPLAKEVPFVEGYMPTPLIINYRFRKWDSLLNFPKPDTALKIMTSLWHFTRGMAFAGKAQIDQAKAEEASFKAISSQLPPDAVVGFNSARQVCAIAAELLRGTIAKSQGNLADAIASFREAVAITDTLRYDEPEGWYVPAREALGGALLLAKKYSDAEKAFRKDLTKHRHNPRSLFGLHEALIARKKFKEAEAIQNEIDSTWEGSKLTIDDLL